MANLLDKLSSAVKPQSNGSNSTLKPINNQFTKLLSVTKYLPSQARSKLLSKAFGKIVPFVGTAGVYYESVEPHEVIVRLDNEKAVQNHIGSIHAVAVTLLAETATGFLLGFNLPADRILLVKSYQVNFYRPLKKGQVAAIATLSDEQRQFILDNPKGEMVIPCVIEDREADNNREPITVEMLWAWIPKAELTARREGKKSISAKEADENTENSNDLNDLEDLEDSDDLEKADNLDTSLENSLEENPEKTLEDNSENNSSLENTEQRENTESEKGTRHGLFSADDIPK